MPNGANYDIFKFTHTHGTLLFLSQKKFKHFFWCLYFSAFYSLFRSFFLYLLGVLSLFCWWVSAFVVFEYFFSVTREARFTVKEYFFRVALFKRVVWVSQGKTFFVFDTRSTSKFFDPKIVVFKPVILTPPESLFV